MKLLPRVLLLVVIISLITFCTAGVAEEKEKGKAFIAAKAQEDGVQSHSSGIYYKVLKEGTGKVHPGPTDVVEVHYEGSLIDGSVFDSSYQRGQTISFGLNQVIRGWTIGVGLMTEGAVYELYIPSDLAYGDRGAGGRIPGGATLVFKVELFKIKSLKNEL